MVKLEITKVDKYNSYHLLDNESKMFYVLSLEFYGIEKPTVGNIIAIDERLLDPRYEGYCQPYAFELCKNKFSMPKDDAEYIALKTERGGFILKRIYG